MLCVCHAAVQEAEAETAARLTAAERALERRAGEVEHLQLQVRMTVCMYATCHFVQVSTLKAERFTLERDRATALAELEELTSRLGAPLLLKLRTEGPTAVASLEQLQQLQRLEAMRDEAQHAVRTVTTLRWCQIAMQCCSTACVDHVFMPTTTTSTEQAERAQGALLRARREWQVQEGVLQGTIAQLKARVADLEQGHSGEATATALLRQQLESVQREVEGVRAGKQALEQQMQAQLALVAARKDAEIAGLHARLDAAATR